MVTGQVGRQFQIQAYEPASRRRNCCLFLMEEVQSVQSATQRSMGLLEYHQYPGSEVIIDPMHSQWPDLMDEDSWVVESMHSSIFGNTATFILKSIGKATMSLGKETVVQWIGRLIDLISKSLLHSGEFGWPTWGTTMFTFAPFWEVQPYMPPQMSLSLNL